MERVPGRVCWSCKHFLFLDGSPSYSELTPGDDSTMDCAKKVFEYRSLGCISMEEMRDTLMTAETCQKFEARKTKEA